MSPGALGPPTPMAVPFTIGVLPDICPCGGKKGEKKKKKPLFQVKRESRDSIAIL